MAKGTTSSNSPTLDVAIVSRLKRIVHLPWNPPEGSLNKAQVSVTLVPGVNFISAESARNAGLDSALSVFSGSIAAEDPTKISDYEAAGVAAISGNRQALRIWRSKESRPTVLAAIDKRLNGAA